MPNPTDTAASRFDRDTPDEPFDLADAMERDGLTCSSCGATGIKGQAEAAVHAIRRDGRRVCDAR